MTRASAIGAALPEPFPPSISSAITASAAALDEVGPIEAAYPEWLAKHHRRQEAEQALREAKKQYREPERPLWHPALEEGGYRTLVGDRPGRRRTCLDDRDKNVAWLRERIAMKPCNGWGHETRVQAARRAQATLDKILAWRADRDRAAEAVGLPTAEAKVAQAKLLEDEARDAIFDLEPTTYREAAFKAAVIYANWHEGAAVFLIRELQVLAGLLPPIKFDAEA